MGEKTEINFMELFKQIGNSEILAERQGKGRKGVQRELLKGSIDWDMVYKHKYKSIPHYSNETHMHIHNSYATISANLNIKPEGDIEEKVKYLFMISD